MATPRKSPYLWTTWLTKIIAGEQACEWATWFKAHFHDFAKIARTGDLVAWTANHGEMVRRRADELRADGYTVFVEDQNRFTLVGRAATLGGKADIVAVKGEEVIVSDCKSGKPRDSDHFQVLIYIMALPLAHHACIGKSIRGEVEYRDTRVEIKTLTDVQFSMIVDVIERVASEIPAPKAPSFRECKFCELTTADCRERVEHETPATETALF